MTMGTAAGVDSRETSPTSLVLTHFFSWYLLLSFVQDRCAPGPVLTPKAAPFFCIFHGTSLLL